MKISFDDISEIPDENSIPIYDRPNHPINVHNTNPYSWSNTGYIHLKNFIPHDIIDAYCAVRSQLEGDKFYSGWPIGTPYMYVPAMRDLALYKPLMDALEATIGEEMALNLILSGWVSTERNWHQDIYLSPKFINQYYLACWFALDDISEDCGAFEYVPGSHKWPTVRMEKVFKYLSPSEQHNPDWPRLTEGWVSDAMEAKRQEAGLPVEKFLGKKGDVLIWHCKLSHRGSPPRIPGTLRKSLIAHYSGINHRKDMPIVSQHKDAGKYFVL